MCERLVRVKCQGGVKENREFHVSDCRKTLKQSLHTHYEEKGELSLFVVPNTQS